MSLKNASPSWKNDLALLFVVVVWGVNFAVVKAALEVMHPHVLNFFRFIVSALVLGGLYLMQQRRTQERFFQPLKTHRREIISLGLLGFFFYQFCFIVGVNNTKAGSAALIMASAPLWTAVLSHVFRYENLPKSAWAGLLTTFGGVLIIVLGGSKGIDFGTSHLFGNVLMMLAAMLWGAYTAFNKPVSRHTSPVSISFLGLLFALPLLFGLGVPYLADVAWDGINLWVWLAILFSGGLSVGLTVAIWNTAVKNVGPSQTAVYSNLVPIIGLISGVVLLNESVTAVQIAGGVLILGGLVLTRRARTKTPAAV